MIPSTNRRQFLSMVMGAGALGLGATAWLVGEKSTADAPKNSNPGALGLQSFTQTSSAFGTNVSMTVLDHQRPVAVAAISAAFAELDDVEKLMSIYRPSSQLCRLNRDGALDHPHPTLVEVLRRAKSMSQRTGGAFDVTVQPLWALYAKAQKAGQLPTTSDIESERQKIDWRRIEISSRRIRLLGRGTEVTLNGIAQGLAADRAIAALRAHGVEHALVNTGEIGSLGTKAKGQPWKVGIQHPRNQDAYISLAKLAGRCLATSGDYATSFNADHSYNHLFDPRTGRSPQSFSSVTVAAPTAIQADALSTAVFVLGTEEGLKLIQNTSEADALLVLKDGRTMRTEGFPTDG